MFAATGLCGWVVVAAPPPAYASCAGPPEPSPQAFVGRVIATESDDRVATVRTTDGETVQVVGTPSPGENSATSVDRTYVVGATYEFHPYKGTEPYEDNICTATERLHGDEIPDELRGDLPASPGSDVPASDGDGGAAATLKPQPDGDEDNNDIVAAGAIAGAAAAASGAGLWLWRRTREHNGDSVARAQSEGSGGA